MQTSNPAFNENLLSHFDHAGIRSTTMTVAGTAVKTFVLLGLLVVSGAWSYNEALNNNLGGEWIVGSLVGGLVVGLVTIFKPTIAGWTAPVYSVLQGILLGAISHQFDARFPGIVIQAVALTCGTLFMMLFLYSARVIRVTNQLATAITAGVGAIFLIYLATWVAHMFGVSVPYLHDSGPIGIGFSVFVVGLAAFSLLLDFDFIERGSEAGLPKSMEWYGAFGLIVTLVWLYREILRLLGKIQSRD